MGAAGALHLILDQERLRAVAPSLVRLLPADQLAALLATTRLVGMECPGCRSVYSELRFTATPVGPLAPSAPAQLEWSVKTFDARFSRIEIAASAPAASMRVVSFLRPAQQAQPSYASVKMKVAPNAFVGRCVLVVGGSRGLGELCAKLLGAGGAHVRLTYNVGAGDAQRVVDEIGHGGGHADVIQWDVLSGGAALMQSLTGWQPTYIYYFASPPIFVGSGRFSAKLFGRFCDYYVAGFADLVRSVREVASGRLSVFYPSSIAVDKPPRDMMEYAAAKAAGEVVCRYLESADPGLRIRVVRLPRLPTDQTASLYPADTADPLPLLAEIVTAG
jgi:NAD(P)-dependent dehydrogenase (short-subunit alcohol dehydrogenase family)